MNKSVIIFSTSDSRHVFNFISVVLHDRKIYDDITIFDLAYIPSIPEQFADYYRANNIKIVTPSHPVNCKIHSLKSLINFLSRTFALLRLICKKKESFAYCFIHYCSWQSMLWSIIFRKHFTKTVPVFWGGDVLRNKHINNWVYRNALKHSAKIVLANENSLRVFNAATHNAFAQKATVIQFPQKMVAAFLEYEQQMPPKKQLLQKFGYPNDKKIVLCGHTATRAERYEEIIDELDLLPDDVKSQCHFVFMMTYAPEEYISYQNEVESLMQTTGLSFTVEKKYMDYNTIQELHNITDIHITNIRTDALSCFLQEELLSGSILVYGNWLKYYEIENPSFFALPFGNIKELGTTLTYVLNNFDTLKKKSAINRQGIIKLASEEEIVSRWNKILK